MDTKIPPPSESTHGGSITGAAKFLSNLPSRGFLSSSPTIPSSNLGGMRVYICDHDTSPPEDQLIKTDQMNILIRSLLLKKQTHKNAESSSGASRKRAADKMGGAADRASSKRAATEKGDSLQGLTVERIRMILREKGLSVKGKKDELIARLRTANNG